MRSIAMYMILDSFVGIILPHGKYKKYISLVSGLILILIMVAPINKVIDFMTAFHLPQSYKFMENISEVCDDAIAKQISDIAHKIGMEVVNVQIDKKETSEMMQVRAIKIKLAEEIDIDEEQKFRQILTNLYGAERIDFN